MRSLTSQGRVILGAGSALSFVLGSVHAFSVFLEPLEQAFGASRADVSLTYSLALVSITLAVTFGHRIYGLLTGWTMALLVGTGAATGALLAGSAGALQGVWLGYGVVFGAANGLGYGYALQLSAQANPQREGLAMGVVTAAYALGATAFPVAFQLALEGGGFTRAMQVLAASTVIVCALAAGLLGRAGARFEPGAPGNAARPLDLDDVFVFWLAYGTAVAAGLMATGHATGIARTYGTASALLVTAPMVIAICNMAGSLAGGWLIDRVAARPLMAALPLVSALALFTLATGLTAGVLAALGVVGLIYGAVISVYPAVIARRFGVAAGVRVYGLVFTAWAVAGLGGPWFAGELFDRTGGYGTALLVAGGLGLLSALIAAFNGRWRA